MSTARWFMKEMRSSVSVITQGSPIPRRSPWEKPSSVLRWATMAARLSRRLRSSRQLGTGKGASKSPPATLPEAAASSATGRTTVRRRKSSSAAMSRHMPARDKAMLLSVRDFRSLMVGVTSLDTTSVPRMALDAPWQ